MNIKKQFLLWFWLSLAIAAAVCVGFLVFRVDLHASVLTTLTLTLAVTILQVGAAWYFVTNLGAFKVGLKISFVFLAISLILLALAQLQLPLLSVLDLWRSAWAEGGLLLLPYVIGTIGTLVGVRKLAHLLNVRSALWSVPSTLFASFVAGAVAWFVPFVFIPEPTSGQLIFGALIAFMAVASFSAARTAWTIRSVIGVRYAAMAHWLALAISLYAIEMLHEFVVIHVLPIDSWYINYGISLWPLLVVAAIFLASGLAFRNLSREFGK